MSTVIEEVAHKLGLTCGLKPGLMPLHFAQGQLDGQEVRCSWADRGTRIEAPFEPALDLGLHVRSRGFANMPSLGRRVLLGDSNWDDEVIATADEPARAAVLFADDARGAVLRLNATSIAFEVLDDRVVTHVLLPEVDSVIQALAHAARVAALVAVARRAVPVAEPLEALAAPLRAFAREHHLGLEESPLHLRGELRSVRLAARFVRTGRGEFDLDVRAVPLDVPPGFGLAVRRESTLDRVRTFFGGQDLETRDPLFDPAFLVRSDDVERALSALDGDVRALLLDLGARFDHLAVDGAVLAARTPATRIRPGDLVMLLEATCTVSERVARAATTLSRGPYR